MNVATAAIKGCRSVAACWLPDEGARNLFASPIVDQQPAKTSTTNRRAARRGITTTPSSCQPVGCVRT